LEKAFCRIRLAAGLLLLLLLASRAVHADDTAPTTDTDFDVVQVDLNGQFFNRLLPFDVPFIITGAVPAGVSTLRVRCQVLDAQGKPEKECWPEQVWRNTTDPAAPSPRFRVLVPRLEAEHYFQFVFAFEKKITSEEAQAFAIRVAAAFDPVLWGTSSSSNDLPLRGDLTTDEVKTLRQRLMDSLQQVTGVSDVATPGSIFNSATPFEDVRRDFKQILLPVRDAQGAIRSAVATYQGELPNLNQNLAQLRTDPPLIRLRDALKSEAAPAGSQAHADTIDAALAVENAPLLLLGDPALASADALSAFLERSDPYYKDAEARIGALRTLLGNGLLTSEGKPQPFLGPLIEGGRITLDEVKTLVEQSRPTGLVGSIDRALARVDGDLLGDAGVQGALQERSTAVSAMAREYRRRVENVTGVSGSTVGNFQTQSNNYISADTGFSCSPELSECSTYVGSNFYFAPVNKAAPLRQFGPFFSRESLKRRVALMLGLTVQGIADDKTREDLFGSQSLLVGLGARMTNSVRLTAGALVFRKLSPNPLSTDKKLTTTYFFSMSFDIDVVPALKGFGKLFTP